jgi:serine O-acetyltransferase
MDSPAADSPPPTPDAGSGAAEDWLGPRLQRLSRALAPCANCAGSSRARRSDALPGQQAIVDVLKQLIGLLFPGCHGRGERGGANDPALHTRALADVALLLRDQIFQMLAFHRPCPFCRDCGTCRTEAETAVGFLLDALPSIRDMLQEDITAAYEGDPAARSTMEVVLSYPGLYAVIVHRIAHALHQAGVPIIPRVMSEHAHSLTGIDIHPGATIGPGFFIDHGTGVVIGETCTIGRRVKLYQGVTLGALSFAKDADGNLVKGIKRHPDVEDNVVVYAGATILGGNTRIGHDSVIGANVWLIHSVPPFSKVYNQEPEPDIRTHAGH